MTVDEFSGIAFRGVRLEAIERGRLRSGAVSLPLSGFEPGDGFAMLAKCLFAEQDIPAGRADLTL